MRYRQLSPSGDSTFASGFTNFLFNSPAAVAQATQTRLLLFTEEWFLDLSVGTPYTPDVLGTNTAATRDEVIKAQILGTEGVTGIEAYDSVFDPNNRSFTVQATVGTQYSQTPVVVNVPIP
jgi:hypothetical protein